MAKDRNRREDARQRAGGQAFHQRETAARQRAMRAGRRCAEAMCYATHSLVSAMARGVDYIDWLLGLDGSE